MTFQLFRNWILSFAFQFFFLNFYFFVFYSIYLFFPWCTYNLKFSHFYFLIFHDWVECLWTTLITNCGNLCFRLIRLKIAFSLALSSILMGVLSRKRKIKIIIPFIQKPSSTHLNGATLKQIRIYDTYETVKNSTCHCKTFVTEIFKETTVDV